MSRHWAGGSTRRWRKIRQTVLDRDEHRCRLQLPAWGPAPDQQCQGKADCVHHTRGRGQTGDDPAYLVAACSPCNLHLGEPDTDPTPAPTTRW